MTEREIRRHHGARCRRLLVSLPAGILCTILLSTISPGAHAVWVYQGSCSTLPDCNTLAPVETRNADKDGVRGSRFSRLRIFEA